ncbi:uncharacterized protein K452DRAFT_288433 [Aplosporella prunicola CBS 121167]|uniref:Uncharacterized protein n=1 Tax=Aplosporella prunicola CBS 121167 TaxID=1176127 RepID=A0A6A6BAF0_9PEZI|nr:uncharacterized protein K452DRAFT_288433 [Aplosporella prunicola CBS 121167]KAF2141060.1 hypothetical protein K452DRAFT_288433 [Aplosporella prunicola CBS 121167]
MICLLLGAGASINAIDNEGNTALHRTIRKAGSPEVASLLLHRGADPNATNKAGETVLHVAAARTKGAALIQLLLEHRAKIEAKDISEATPLHVAIQSRYYENVKILLANGADLTEKDKNGRDAAKLAHRASPEIDDIIGRTKKQRQNSRVALSTSRRGSTISSIPTESESDNLPQARNHSIATTFRQRLFQKKEFHGPNG